MLNYRTTLIANNVQILNKEVDFLFTSEDVKKIKKFANQKQGVTFIFAKFCLIIDFIGCLFLIQIIFFII